VAAGALLLGVGWMVLFAMTVRWIPPDLSISLAAYGVAVAGLALGMAGAAGLVRRTRR
jgi:hypothetical protein